MMGPPRMFSLPVFGPKEGGGEAGLRFDDGNADDENRPSTSSSSPPEWALVELQGEVQPPAGALPEENFTAGRLVLKVSDCLEEKREKLFSSLFSSVVDFFKIYMYIYINLDLSPETIQQPNGGVELIVGNHLLEGSFVDLKKPFAVLKKEGGRGGGRSGGEGEGEGGSNDDGSDGKGSAPSEGGAVSTRYKVVGVIRRKCLFKSRPRALIARLT